MNFVAARLRWLAAIWRYLASCAGSMSMLIIGICFAPVFPADAGLYLLHVDLCVSSRLLDGNGNTASNLSDGAAHKERRLRQTGWLSDGELNLNLRRLKCAR